MMQNRQIRYHLQSLATQLKMGICCQSKEGRDLHQLSSHIKISCQDDGKVKKDLVIIFQRQHNDKIVEKDEIIYCIDIGEYLKSSFKLSLLKIHEKFEEVIENSKQQQVSFLIKEKNLDLPKKQIAQTFYWIIQSLDRLSNIMNAEKKVKKIHIFIIWGNLDTLTIQKMNEIVDEVKRKRVMKTKDFLTKKFANDDKTNLSNSVVPPDNHSSCKQ